MRLLRLIENSCHRGSKESSKRIIMYLFTGMAFLMLTTEALLNLILIYLCYSKGDTSCEFKMVFDGVIYAAVFGLIGTLAGINGYQNNKAIKNDSEIIQSDNQ